MAPMLNRSFYLLCLLHLRRRRRRKRREREFWEHPIVAARTLEGAYYTLYGRLREDERKFFNYFRMSTSTFDYIVDRLAPQMALSAENKVRNGQMPAYLSRVSPASHRHVGGRPDNFVVSAPCTAWP